MTKDKLIELVKYLKDMKINVELLSDKIKYLSNSDIDIILKSRYPEIMIKLLSNDTFKSLDESIKKELVGILKNNANKRNAKYVLDVITNNDVISKRLVVELAKIVNDSNGAEQAKCASEIAVNKYVLESPNALDIVKSISLAVGPYQAKCASSIAKNITVLYCRKALELIQIISNASKDYQAEYALKVALNENLLLMNENAVELTRIVATSKGIPQAYYASFVSQNPKILKSGKEVKLAKILSKYPSEKIKYLTFPGCHNIAIFNLFDVNTVIAYLMNILNIQDENVLNSLYNDIIIDINKRKLSFEEENSLNNSNDFWQIFSNNSEEAMELLEKVVPSNVELAPDLLIRRK